MRAKQIRELVKIVEESTIGELEITRWWGQKIRISKGSGSMASAPVREIAVSPPAQAETPPAPQSEASKQPEIKSNQIEFKAPMVGTFYRSPSPDSEPYVKEGDIISPGRVLCIIEAMKLMNEIEAESNGRIVKILAENAQPVEYNQPLFLIEVD
ncbi:acetyl-CoA carboxylase biotin carboxyl carrier protein [candidate division KSB1 bacterium]|nr:acetyl-CoA carboxylase biotin carboxyl carrier protein [candidate division KSB1 bacterium]